MAVNPRTSDHFERMRRPTAKSNRLCSLPGRLHGNPKLQERTIERRAGDRGYRGLLANQVTEPSWVKDNKPEDKCKCIAQASK